MGSDLHVLIVEESKNDALTLIHELKQGGFEPHHERVETAAAMRSALQEKSWDVILSDDRVLDLNCLEAIELLKETGLDIPFIIISRTITEEMAIEAIKAGANDCIENRRQRIVPTIERELRSAGIRRKSQQAEEELSRNRDIVERQAEEMAVIAEIGRLIGSTLNIEEVYDRFAAEVKKLIPFDRIVVNLREPQKDAWYVAYVSGVGIPARRQGDYLPLAGSISENIMRTRSGMLLHPASLEEMVSWFPSAGATVTYRAGMRSFMGVPLISRDEVIGALHFRLKKPNAYTKQDLRLAERIGEQIAGAIANAQLFNDLKRAGISLYESEARFRAIFEQAAVGVAEIEIGTNRFLTVNRWFCEMVGRTEGELLNCTIQAITHPDDLHLHLNKMAQLVAGKISDYNLEKRYLRKDGAIIWVNLTTSPLWKPGETPTRNLIVVQDITERVRMQEQNEHRAKQLSVLHKTSVEITAELNLNALLHFIAQHALNLIGGTYCNCYIYMREADQLERVATAGQELIPSGKAPLRGEGLVGRIWATGAPLLVDDYRSWPWRRKEYDSFPSRALVGVPVHWGKEFLGVLSVMAFLPHRFTGADVEILSMFATQAAIAIRNARLYNIIEHIAVTDELTGLFNRRGFFQLGEREFERTLRFNRPLAALMFDIDHFKRINDTYGHPAGDQVLRALASCFCQNTRGIDVAGRYGGEEFVLLMPETLLPEAIQIAERLRQSIADLSIPICPANSDSMTIDIRVTVSIGVASLLPGIHNLTALLDRVDQALYRAKDSGRNRVVVWEESSVP